MPTTITLRFAPATAPSKLREPNTREFVHSWNALLGGICRSGFCIEDVSEPLHAKPEAEVGSFGHRCQHIPPYIRIKARRAGQTGPESWCFEVSVDCVGKSPISDRLWRSIDPDSLIFTVNRG